MFVHTRTHEAADDERSIMRESAQQQSTLQKAKENRRETPKRSLSNKFQFGFLGKRMKGKSVFCSFAAVSSTDVECYTHCIGYNRPTRKRIGSTQYARVWKIRSQLPLWYGGKGNVVFFPSRDQCSALHCQRMRTRTAESIGPDENVPGPWCSVAYIRRFPAVTPRFSCSS